MTFRPFFIQVKFRRAKEKKEIFFASWKYVLETGRNVAVNNFIQLITLTYWLSLFVKVMVTWLVHVGVPFPNTHRHKGTRRRPTQLLKNDVYYILIIYVYITIVAWIRSESYNI